VKGARGRRADGISLGSEKDSALDAGSDHLRTAIELSATYGWALLLPVGADWHASTACDVESAEQPDALVSIIGPSATATQTLREILT